MKRHKPIYHEIKSKSGELVFRRWRLIQTKWFNIFLHNIIKPDGDKHMHSHPWNFWTFVLRGAYEEEVLSVSCSKPVCCGKIFHRKKERFSLTYHPHKDFHRSLAIYGKSGVWTLVFAGPDKYEWGYFTQHGVISNEEYRARKANGTL